MTPRWLGRGWRPMTGRQRGLGPLVTRVVLFQLGDNQGMKIFDFRAWQQ